tara:strand:+ start:426 stop:773 length:348 start_codon:yes stop_codon:yes gene_type:complete
MASFAKLGIGNIVEQVVVVNDNVATSEQTGIEFLQNLYGDRAVWKQTYMDGSKRKNFASKGFKYNQTLDAFIPPQAFKSWTLNTDTCLWEAPVAHPADNNFYNWNETNQTWDLVE